MSLLLTFSKNINGFCKRLHKKNINLSENFLKIHYSNQTKKEDNQHNNNPLKTETFEEHIKFRKDEAKRSVVVQVQSAQSYKELYTYCNSIGTVKNMLHYSSGVDTMHLIVVEFAKESDVKSAFMNSIFMEDQQVVPVQSQFMWFRATNKKQAKPSESNISLLVENGHKILKDSEIKSELQGCCNISDQMIKLYNLTKLNDLGVRIRFLVAKQVEMAISGMFPSASALPFGSSVNGYGKMGCDLDLVLKLNNVIQSVTDDSRLVFHSKATLGSERTTSQRHMEALGDILQLFLPGCSQVRRILQARVPIIKYYQQLADVECDLSMSNLSGVHMSDFLYLMGNIDERVRPLVFTIRKWASEVGLTNSSPGRWITNFSLTLLVLNFLQNTSTPILPSLNQLVQLASEKDKYVTDEGINCTFLRDHKKYLSIRPTTNNEDLQTLLKQFFEYYSSFDFHSKAVSLNDASAIAKPEHSALYIVNPLERGLNVSKNVSLEELDKFKSELRNAAWLLESEDDNATSNWGLLNLLRTTKKKPIVRAYSAYTPHKQGKLIEVSTLFEEADENNENVEFKNKSVEQQVLSIKKDTKQNLKKYAESLKLNVEKSGR